MSWQIGRTTFFLGLASVIILALVSSSSTSSQFFKGDEQPAIIDLRKDSSTPEPTFDLTIPVVPETANLPAQVSESTKYAWDQFAWQTFIAMNWPAVIPSKSNGYLRGFPDVTKKFENAGFADALVWETLKEKREVFNSAATTIAEAKPKPWNYRYFFPAEPGATGVGATGKRLHSSSKTSFVTSTPGSDATLDETVEVQAEAREPFYKGSNAKYKGMPTVARVFRDEPGSTPDSAAVRYEVKVNYDFYNYVIKEKLYYDSLARARALHKTPAQLPWRISGPSSQVNPYKKTNYYTGATLDTIKARISRATSSRHKKGDTLLVPPRTGAIHVKAAWVPISGDEKGRFIHREAEFFSGSEKQVKKRLFGLVGLHIIQRIMIPSDTNGNLSYVGGTFIFSTWEHREIRENEVNTTYKVGKTFYPTKQYRYTNYFKTNNGDFVPSPGLENTFKVSRLYPILKHTAEANQALWNKLDTSSVWNHYRLVGTQFRAENLKAENPISGNGQSISFKVDTTKLITQPGDTASFSKPQNLNQQKYQPVYLANLAIETNLGLQQFQGQPPGFQPVPNYADNFRPNRGISFIRLKEFGYLPHNLQAGGKAYNMGGCMGCHGVAQLNGYSFSFVLLGGQAGAKPDSEKDFEAPLGNRIAGRNAISLLTSNSQVTIRSEFSNSFISDSSGSAVQSPDKSSAHLTITKVDNEPQDQSFKYGDQVYITTKNDSDTLYLAATTDPVPGVYRAYRAIFTNQKTDSSKWHLIDPLRKDSKRFVLNTKHMAFKNKTVNFNGANVYLTVFPDSTGTINLVPYASTEKGSLEMWQVQKVLQVRNRRQ